ncbi:MAG TPA: 50S ribosomal protein L25, partial [bacterium]|nr:50S ribosomal protein L25 [bacterium]
MQRAELHVALRKKTGKGVARSLRREGRIPGVVYGGQDPPQPIDIDGRELWQLLHTSGGEHLLVNLHIGAGKDQGTLTLMKELQHNPLRGDLEHVDFQRISIDRPILTTVSIHITGSSAGEREGGVMEHMLRELNIECLPLEIPDAIAVDISPLGIGQ